MIGKDDRKEYTILKYLLLVFFSRKRDALIGETGGPLNGKATDSFLQDSQQRTARKALCLVWPRGALCLTFGGMPLWQLELAARRQL